MSLPAMRRDGERRLVRRDVVVWIAGIGAGWSAETQDSAISDIFALFVEPAELGGMMVIK